jgi:hypothetical protein
VDRRRHLARRAAHPAVGDESDAKALLLQRAKRRRQLVQLRHAVRARALEADHCDDVAREPAGVERFEHPSCESKTSAGASTTQRSAGTDETLMTARPRLPARSFKPALLAERLRRRAHDRLVAARRRQLTPRDAAVGALGHLRVVAHAAARDGRRIGVQAAGVDQLAQHEARAAGSLERVDVGAAVRIDARKQRRRTRQLGEVGPVDRDRRRARDRDPVDDVVGRAAGREQRDHRVDDRALVDELADRQQARFAILRGALPAGVCKDDAHCFGSQRVAQAIVRMDERGAGHVQAHRLEQHLVAVRGAVERAGPRAVVRRRLGRHQRVAADLPQRVLLAHARLLDVRKAARHRPAGDEQARQMTEVERPDQQPRDDLVADAEQQRGIEGVVRERDRSRHRDRVAREEAEVHPRPSLRDAVAHRGDAAGHLRGRAERVRGGADHRGKRSYGWCAERTSL